MSFCMTKYIAKKPNKNGYIDFTAHENATWQILIERQLEVIKNRACDEFIEGLNKLALPINKIPQCNELSEVLRSCTGFSVVPVDAIIPLERFFQLLANRQFPAATFIRLREELDYLQEPDIFHEFFGHCPLLTNNAYADFVQWYGETALKAEKKVQSLLGRLFWFTIEFGLINTTQGLRIYGGGILSSFSETIFSLENETPKRVPFELLQVFNTPYRYDIIQDKYFVINELAELFQVKGENILDIANKLVMNIDKDNNDFVIC